MRKSRPPSDDATSTMPANEENEETVGNNYFLNHLTVLLDRSEANVACITTMVFCIINLCIPSGGKTYAFRCCKESL